MCLASPRKSVMWPHNWFIAVFLLANQLCGFLKADRERGTQIVTEGKRERESQREREKES